MYRIYCDDTLIFDDSDVQQNSFLTDIELDVEAGKAGSLAFVIYPNHPSYNIFNKLTSFITVKQNEDIVFYGRVLSSEDDFYGARKIVVEGALAFFNDSVVRPYDFSTFSYLHKSPSELLSFFITKHNEQVDITRQFTLGTVTVTLPQGMDLSPSNDSYESTLSNISKYLVEECGGFLITRRVNGVNYIDYLSEFTNVSNQTIEFGENLLDITQTIDGEDVATAIIPLGADEEVEEEYIDPETGVISLKKVRKPITIVGVIDPETHEEITVDYLVNQTLADIYGVIYRTVNFDDCELRIDLYNKAKEYVQNLSMLTKSIELTALDLSKINVDFDAFRVGTKVNVISEYHGLNDSIGITKMKINLLHPEDSQLTLGKTIETFTEGNTKEVYKTSKIIQKMNQNLEEEIQNIDLTQAKIKLSWDISTHIARIEQTDEEKLVEYPITNGIIYCDCNNYQNLPNFKHITNTPDNYLGYFAFKPIEQDDGTIIYHPFFAMQKIDPINLTVKWYDINDVSFATERTDILIVGTINFNTNTTTLWGVARTLKEANVENFMEVLNTIRSISDVAFTNYAKASGIEHVFDKVAMLEAFINKLTTNEAFIYNLMTRNLKVGQGNDSTGFYLQISDDALHSPVVVAKYNGEELWRINPTNGKMYGNFALVRQYMPFQFNDSLDNTHPMECDFYIPSNASIVSIKLSVKNQKFRATSKAVTEKSDWNKKSATVSGSCTGSVLASGSGHAPSGGGTVNVNVHGLMNGTIVGTAIGNFNHKHDITYGIYESTKCADVKLYIDNGSGYGSAINLGSADNLASNYDITSYFSDNTSWKRIKFTSTQLGRIQAQIMCELLVTT